MHVRHRRLFEWLTRACPGSRLYGPYDHAGRHYFQWMVRGRPLRESLVPFLDTLPMSEIDEHSSRRYVAMKQRYGL